MPKDKNKDQLSRSSNPYARSAFATEKQLRAYDPDIDSLVEEYLDEDKDWLGPGDLIKRPPTYSTTWTRVYKPVSQVTVNGSVFSAVRCEERKKCQRDILLSGTLKELKANGTSMSYPLKPPICHIVPWVMINLVLGQWDTDHPTKVCSAEFRRFACWGIITNLRPGHAACNLAGAKTKVGSYTQAEYDKAENHVDKAEHAYPRARWL